MDWALFFMWARLYQKTPPGPGRDDVWWGLAGSIGHMLEILPLLALLLGVFDAPSIPGASVSPPSPFLPFPPHHTHCAGWARLQGPPSHACSCIHSQLQEPSEIFLLPTSSQQYIPAA